MKCLLLFFAFLAAVLAEHDEHNEHKEHKQHRQGIGKSARPHNTSICDYYAAHALGQANASTEYTLLTLLVNTALVGNYSNSSTSAVPGIFAANATYNGTAVNLRPYFDGELASTNKGGSEGVSVNWLDDGGVAPLKENKPSEGTTSNQYRLLMHLYSFFGTLLGCSDMGQTSFPGYGGETSMYEVHKYMALDSNEVGYFIEQVGLSAKSFGIAEEDIDLVAKGLDKVFGHRCSGPRAVLPDKGKSLQAICIAHDCPKAPHATCKAYDKVVEPKSATAMAPNATASGTTSASATAKNAGAKEFAVSLLLSAAVVVVFVYFFS